VTEYSFLTVYHHTNKKLSEYPHTPYISRN